MFCWQQADRPS